MGGTLLARGCPGGTPADTACTRGSPSLPGPPGQIYGMGIRAIETGVLDVRDTLIYQTTGSFLHACNTDIEAARKAVNHVMGSVLEGASEHVPGTALLEF